MATTSTFTAIAAIEPVFTEPERLALAGFLAGYTGLTREAYALDLRQYASWCQQNHLRLFQARRADIECFARDLEARGRARATITRRLCTIAGLYRYAVEEELLDHSRPPMSDGPAWTTSPTPPGWTVTSLARCWSLLGSALLPSTRSSRCWP
jgi:Phage integrase, N-terminal SAM-like domain